MTGRVHTEGSDSYVRGVNGLGQNAEWHVSWHCIDSLSLSKAYGNGHLYRVSQNKFNAQV